MCVGMFMLQFMLTAQTVSAQTVSGKNPFTNVSETGNNACMLACLPELTHGKVLLVKLTMLCINFVHSGTMTCSIISNECMTVFC